MCNYYEEEPYYNPEDFLEEYEVNLREIITKAVNDKIKKTIDDLAVIKSQNEVLTQERNELRNQARNIDRLHKEELDKAIKENTKEVTRKFACGFAPHDEIYYIKSKGTNHKCEKCNGKGRVQTEVLGKEVEVSCPHCSFGHNTTYFYYPEKDIVTTISFTIYRKDRNNKNSGSEMGELKIWLEKYDYEMSISKLYKTLEECQAECDIKNEKENGK